LDFVQVDISAIKQSDSQNNAYVLLLNETVGKRQLPIVIGWCEARSIAIALDGTEEPDRPLTHDLFKTMGDKFNITVQKIVIHTLIEGIFHSSFHCKHKDTGEEVAIDARTSDAIAIAIRYGCPIFTYEDILSRAGIIVNSARKDDGKDIESLNLTEEDDKMAEPQKINALSLTKLKDMLAKAIDEEDYEKASEIRDEINKRKEK
jgi:bifunctional DNase/RNase